MSEENPLIKEIKGLSEAMGETNKAINERQEKGETKSQELEKKLDGQHDQLIEAVKKLEVMEKAFARRSGEGQEETISIDMKSFNKSLKASGKKEIDLDSAKEIKAALLTYMQKGQMLLNPEEFKSINTVIDSDGGYLVPEEIGDTKEKRFDKNGVMDVIARRNSATGSYSEFIDWNDYDKAYMKNELDGLAAATPDENFIKMSWNAKSQFYPKVFTREALDDISSIESDVVGRMMKGADRSRALQVISGAAQDAARGILSYPAGTAFGEVEQIESTTSAEFKWDDLFVKLLPALKDDYHEGASIIMNRRAFFKLISDKDGQSKYQIGNQINFFSGEGLSIAVLGYPVKWETNMPAIAGDALSVAFGNFDDAYLLVERVGFTIHRDESKADKVTVTLRRRFDGKVRNFEAFKILKIKA